jgi:hypothetical protein
MQALVLLKDSPHYRRDAFVKGLQAIGYQIVASLENPKSDDCLIIWNRYRANDEIAKRFEAVKAKVYVIENGYLGKHWQCKNWFAISQNHHCGAGYFKVGGNERWDDWQVDLKPWRTEGETVILGQRGIGEIGIASPDNWAQSVAIKGRVRPHPAKYPAITIQDDLKSCGEVVTWASGAALIALTLGIPVFYQMKQWIGAQASSHISNYPNKNLSDSDRLAMFRRLAWAMWTDEEISLGLPFHD